MTLTFPKQNIMFYSLKLIEHFLLIRPTTSEFLERDPGLYFRIKFQLIVIHGQSLKTIILKAWPKLSSGKVKYNTFHYGTTEN